MTRRLDRHQDREEGMKQALKYTGNQGEWPTGGTASHGPHPTTMHKETLLRSPGRAPQAFLSRYRVNMSTGAGGKAKVE